MRRMVRFGLLLLALGAGSFAAEIFPPNQFRLVDPKGKVEIRAKEGATSKVEAKAIPVVGDRILVGKDAGASLQVGRMAMVYLFEESEFEIAGIEADGRPKLVLVDGGALAKTGTEASKVPLEVRFGANLLKMKSGLVEVRYKAEKKLALAGVVRGGADLEGPAGTTNLSEGEYLVAPDGKTKKRSIDKAALKTRWDYLGESVFRVEIPEIQDEVPPRVTILSPTEGALVPGPEVELFGTVDDPGVESIQVKLDGVFQRNVKVREGQFRSPVVLKKPSQTLVVIAQDAALMSGSAEVVVRCTTPAAPPEPERPKTEPTAVERALAVLKDPSKDPTLFGAMCFGALMAVLIVGLAIRKGLGLMKKGAATAAGLATGVIFHRCEKCGEREYEYHLFYTTEPVTSPFMRNLINNVNPMATSIMNESLENLLNTGLSGSAPAKAADQKIRVTCTWCDSCKVGNLKLEHMRATDVAKTDDYQIIHPIFIEWVRKVYD